MPGTVGDAGQALKRKRSTSGKGPSKRARSASSEEDDDGDVQARILSFGAKIPKSKKYHKYIPYLLTIIRKKDEALSVTAAVSLCIAFTKLIASDQLDLNSTQEVEVTENLRNFYKMYKTEMLELLAEDGEIGHTALSLCMQQLKVDGEHISNNRSYQFPESFLSQMVQVLLKPTSSASVRKEFSVNFVAENDDIRYFTLKAIEYAMFLYVRKQVLTTGRSSLNGSQDANLGTFDSALEIMSAIETVPESEEELEDYYIPLKGKRHPFKLKQHKLQAQRAWLALMNREMTDAQRNVILSLMSETIVPWFVQPERLMDFLTDSYNHGGSTSLHALSGLFYLMQEPFNLDYESFYTKLYSLLDRNLLHSKHRSKFLRLLDTFLSSTHLPAVLVASFVKRLARLALNASPAGLAPVTPWIYNMLKKHPTCTFMVHREPRTVELKEELEKVGMVDPFLMEEEDPMKTKAIDSCLWEIVTLQSHYHPNLATMAKIISEQFTKNAYNMEDVLDHTYDTVSYLCVRPQREKLTFDRCWKTSTKERLRRNHMLNLRYPRRFSLSIVLSLDLRIVCRWPYGIFHRSKYIIYHLTMVLDFLVPVNPIFYVEHSGYFCRLHSLAFIMWCRVRQ